MGQCGCSDTAPDYVLPGPDGITYAIQVYPGCNYCGTPVGIDVHRFDADDTELWANGVAELEFMTYADEGISGIAPIPVLDAEHIIEAVKWWDDSIEVGLRAEELSAALPQAVYLTRSDPAYTNAGKVAEHLGDRE